jgi:gelsolin
MSDKKQDAISVMNSESFKSRVSASKNEKEFQGVGKSAGIHVWRIEKFELKPMPKSEFGNFYSGDSYLILHSEGTTNLTHTIHFWLGSKTSLDESGTAAYKAVELDTFLGSAPTIVRETEGCESPQFSRMFPNGFKILSGGVESGFNHVKPEAYVPKLLHVRGNKRVFVTEDKLSSSSLNQSDTFVLDAGLKVFQWVGSKASINEKYKANMISKDIKDSRKGCDVVELTSDGNEEFWKILGGKPTTIKDKADDDKDVEAHADRTHEVYQIIIDKEHKTFKKVGDGKLSQDMLKSDDVFIVDFGDQICLWIGKKASAQEKGQAMTCCTDYLGVHKRPAWLSISVVHDGHEGPEFKKRMQGGK